MASESADNDNPDLAIEALNHLLQGKRHMLVEDYPSAVTSLQEACQLLDRQYGIGAHECGEAYLYYGSALFELARIEDGVIDGVVHTKLAEISETETEEEEEEEEEDDEDDGDEKEDDSQNKEIDDKKSEEKKTDNEEDIEVSDEDKKQKDSENNEPESSEAKVLHSDTLDSCVPSTSKQTDDIKSDEFNEEIEDNEASNIEIAWEVLSLAKVVFSRSLDQPDMKLKLAETLQKLGEISIEWENNENAIDILNQCLNLRKEVLQDDDRLIAETYYHLGIAFSFSNQCENANNCFQSAIEVIENRIENKRKQISLISPENSDDISSIEREIAQLGNLLPEMRLKIEDSRDQMDNVRTAMENEAQERVKEEEVIIKTQIKDKPINDISHLIKRKRQPSGSDASPKKVLCSNGHNVLNNEKSADIASNSSLS